MTFKRIATACVAFSMVATPAQQVAAENALVGGIIGGIIGGVIVNEANKNRAKKKTYSSSSTSRKKTYTSSSSGISSAQREQNREVQTSLNYFGFPVGTPDGSLGPKSRAAIAEYQVTMGFPGTGQLNDFERDILISSYYRAQSGGAATATLMATNPRGAKGVLIAWKDERLGIGLPQGTLANGTGLGAATFAAPVVAGALAPAMPTFQAAPVVSALPVATALPSFLAQGASSVSLASMCSQVSVATSTNGGYMTQLNMTDPTFALSEQFCIARGYAIAQSDDMVSKVAGFTPQQIAEQCASFAPVMKDHVAAISLRPRAAVIDGVMGFVTSSGMAPAQLAGTAKICLGIGYKVDNAELALGSALLLGVMGERAYGELVGHHLAQGIGATPRPDLALDWFEAALGDPSEPIVQIFAPQMPDRAGLIRMAAYAKAGQPMPGGSIPGAGVVAAPVAAAPEPVIPTFETTPAAQPEASGGFGFKIPFLSNP